MVSGVFAGPAGAVVFVVCGFWAAVVIGLILVAFKPNMGFFSITGLPMIMSV